MAVSIYLVEDEAWIRRGIKKMIQWEALDVTLAGEAEDGLTARQEILDKRPQIIISDIRIPLLDGLELIREISRELTIKTIFVSGYRDFEYARQAVELDAVSYILKPVDADELNRVLARTLEEIRRGPDFREEDYGREKFLADILDHRKEDGSTAVNIPKQAPAFHCVLLIPSDQLTGGTKRFKESLSKELGYSITGEFFRKNKYEYIVVFSSNHGLDFESRMTALCKKMMDQLNVQGAWSLGNVVNALSDIPLSYNHAWMAYVHRDIHRQHGLLTYVSEEKTGLILPDSAVVEKIHFAIKTGKPDKLENEFQTVMHELSASENMGMQSICDSVFYLSMDCIRMLQKDGISTNKYYEKCREFMQQRFTYKTVDDVTDWFYLLLKSMASAIDKSRMRSIEIAVYKVKDYINVHYTEDLTLNDMADMVYINANYLSGSFKKIIGEGFVDYIIKKRVEKAAQILIETNMSVAEISQLVGYENVRHFSRLFRKRLGMTPSEHREHAKQHGIDDLL